MAEVAEEAGEVSRAGHERPAEQHLGIQLTVNLWSRVCHTIWMHRQCRFALRDTDSSGVCRVRLFSSAFPNDNLMD
jgi:hypothetical protein